MNEQNEISARDRRLLEEIEQIALNGDVERQQEDSLHGFCAHLAGAVPQADQDAQQRLETRLVERWKQLYEVGLEKDVEHRADHFQALSRRQPEHRPDGTPVISTPLSFWKRTVLAWAGLAALFVVLISLVIIPEVRTFIGQIIREAFPGDYASVAQIEAQPGGEPSATAENRWMIQTHLGDSGGALPPGADPTVRSFTSVEEAQEHTSLLIREPGYLPAGFTLQEVKLPPEGASEEQAFLFYGDSGQEIVISITRTGEQGDESQPGEVTEITIVQVDGNAADVSLEEVAVGEYQAVWIDGEILVWEVKNVRYAIAGHDLSSKLALRIANSIQ